MANVTRTKTSGAELKILQVGCRQGLLHDDWLAQAFKLWKEQLGRGRERLSSSIQRSRFRRMAPGRGHVFKIDHTERASGTAFAAWRARSVSGNYSRQVLQRDAG